MRRRMDLVFTDEQEMLRQSVRQFIATECPPTYVRKMMADDTGYAEEQWTKMAALGWMGLGFPEEYGGSGLGMIELGILFEEMGRAVMSGPFLPTVLAGLALDLGGSEKQKQRYL